VRRTNGLAIASMVLGIGIVLGWVGVGIIGLVAVIGIASSV